MSQLPNVLIAVGENPSGVGSIPQQTYQNLFTEFNLPKQIDAHFYNTIIKKPSQNVSDFFIYGFMKPSHSYTFKYSIQQIVDFFLQHAFVDIVVCDLLHIYSDFTCQEYIHPKNDTNNIPFFIRKNTVDYINFTGRKLLLQNQLNNLRQQGKVIFHIADPLISIQHNIFESS